MSLLTSLLRGAAAGAAGTTALNAATYLDMTLRGRPSSSTPEQTVQKGAELFGVHVGDDDTSQARASGGGALLGILAGVGTGAVLGAARAAGWHSGFAGTTAATWSLVMLAGNGPMTVLGVSDPRTWGADAWVADVVPHAAYAVVTAATLLGLEPS